MTEPAPDIRSAIANDAAALAHFAAEVFPLGCPPNTDPADIAKYISSELTAERFYTLIEDRDNEILLAETSNGLCGYAMVVQPSLHPQIEAVAPAELRKFYVDPNYHGTGIADVLMRRAMANLKSRHLGVVWLSVYSENLRAVAFYKRWGFYVVGAHDFMVGNDRQKDFLMLCGPLVGKGSR